MFPWPIAFYALVPLVYYGALNAKKENPLHSVFVFDLGGISHFAKENQFPVTFTPEQNALLINGCYQPTLWDIYWNRDPCKFVMAKLEGEKIFGTPALSSAWLRAVTAHPIAYLQHRAAFMRTLPVRRQPDAVDARCRRPAEISLHRSPGLHDLARRR